MKPPRTPYEQALWFIAAYDKPDADVYERHIVRIARRWRSIIRARHSVQRIVDEILVELREAPADYGCGWDDLREKFTAWAVQEKWMQAPDDRGSATGSPSPGCSRP